MWASGLPGSSTAYTYPRYADYLSANGLLVDRQAWDAVFGTVTLGKFFLGFGSIGICEHALDEAAGHLNRRIVYIPIGALNPAKLKKIRVVHVLDSYERRNEAKEFIW